MIYDLCDHMDGYSTKTFYTGQRVLRACSRTTHVHGDEAGTGGGVKSGTVGGICEPIGHAKRVRVEGSEVVRHLDPFWMEDRNTVGEAIFARNLSTFAPPLLDDPVPGSALIKISSGIAGSGSAGLSSSAGVGNTTYTWSNFARAATAEEIGGGGPEDPVADIVVAGTAIIFLGGALWVATHADTARVSRTSDPEFCLIGPYHKIKDLCSKANGETHHIVPDMVYRLDVRPTGAAEDSPKDRIPNSPTLNQGMSICLTTGNHRRGEDAVHSMLNPALNTLGAANTPSGTAPMPDILKASTAALMAVQGVSGECKRIAIAATTAQAAPMLGQPGRTTTSLPSPDARRVLQQGHY